MKNFLKKQKRKLIRYRKNSPGVYLFGLRRGGTTMVADAIMANSGVYHVNEPFAVLPVHPAYELKKSLLPDAPHSHFFGLSELELIKFGDYVRKLEQAEIRDLGGVAKPEFPFNASRLSLKILNAPWMIDWFSEHTDSHILSMLRHPAAQAMSVIRQKWEYPTTAYAARLDDLSGYLTPAQVRYVEDNSGGGTSDWEMAILDWCVTSAPLRHPKADKVIKIKYEDIVQSPEQFVNDVLVAHCDLKDQQAMLTALGRPSNSSRMATDEANSAILQRDVAKIIDGWQTRVDEKMRKDAQNILDVFEVEEYSMERGHSS